LICSRLQEGFRAGAVNSEEPAGWHGQVRLPASSR